MNEDLSDKELKSEFKKATEAWEGVADAFLQKELCRPINFGDLLWTLAVLNTLRVAFLEDLSSMIDKDSGHDWFNPISSLEHWKLRDDMLELAFSHLNVNKGGNEAFHRIWGEEYEKKEGLKHELDMRRAKSEGRLKEKA